MGYVYAAMWFIAGLILIFRLSKENKIFYVAGGFFLVLAITVGVGRAGHLVVQLPICLGRGRSTPLAKQAKHLACNQRRILFI